MALNSRRYGGVRSLSDFPCASRSLVLASPAWWPPRGCIASHEVTVFEAGSHVGGHTNTVDVDWQGRRFAVDTGFIVFNDWTYPRFIALLNELGVEYQSSNMSFSLRDERNGLEYNGTSVNTLFAQRLNALRPSFLRMIADILRFNRRSRAAARRATTTRLRLATTSTRIGYSRAFREQFIVPMGMSIWSATERAMLSFPARFFVEFFDKHGFLNVDDRPVWQAVKGGSREYMRKLAAPLAASHPAQHRRSPACSAMRAGVARSHGRGGGRAFRPCVLRLPQRPGAAASSKTRPPRRQRDPGRVSVPGKRSRPAHRCAPAAAHAARARGLELSSAGTSRQRDARPRRAHLRHERAAVARCAGEDSS